MRKWLQNYILFAIMFLLALCQLVSGTVLWFVLPHGGGYQGGRGQVEVESSFIWTRNGWIDFHDWTAVALLVIVIIHLILHWKWITFMTKKAFVNR